MRCPCRVRRRRNERSFAVKVFNLPPDAAILDMCCGHARHNVGLARRGYRAVGTDTGVDQVRKV
jgi:hypothetical protein